MYTVGLRLYETITPTGQTMGVRGTRLRCLISNKLALYVLHQKLQ